MIGAIQGNGPKLTLRTYMDFTNVYVKNKEDDIQNTYSLFHYHIRERDAIKNAHCVPERNVCGVSHKRECDLNPHGRDCGQKVQVPMCIDKYKFPIRGRRQDVLYIGATHTIPTWNTSLVVSLASHDTPRMCGEKPSSTEESIGDAQNVRVLFLHRVQRGKGREERARPVIGPRGLRDRYKHRHRYGYKKYRY